MKKLGFGLMRLPMLAGTSDEEIDVEKTRVLTDRFLAEGFTYFDTAYIYNHGYSEKALGTVISDRYPREAFTVTTKLPVMNLHAEADYEKVFQEELERCHVEYFDWYFLHAINHDMYPELVRLHAFEFIQAKKAAGKIRHIGFSWHDDAESLDRILSEHPEIELVQLQINYLDWDSEDVQSRRCYEVCEKYGKDVAVMEPLKGGNLVNIPEEAARILKDYNPNASIASWGIRFAASLPNVIVVLSGMNTMEQLEDNISYMRDFQPLSQGELAVLDQVKEIIRRSMPIACTACRYCTAGCPKKIAIPDYFAMYNISSRFGMEGTSGHAYAKLKSENGAPSECIQCRACEKHCPQHLPIVENLVKVRKVFEMYMTDEDMTRQEAMLPEEYGMVQWSAFDIHGNPIRIVLGMNDTKTKLAVKFFAFGEEQLLCGRLTDGKFQPDFDQTGHFAQDAQRMYQSADPVGWRIREKYETEIRHGL